MLTAEPARETTATQHYVHTNYKCKKCSAYAECTLDMTYNITSKCRVQRTTLTGPRSVWSIFRRSPVPNFVAIGLRIYDNVTRLSLIHI